MLFGIGIWRNSDAMVRNCTISANTRVGVFLNGGSTGEFIKSTIEQQNHQGTGMTIRKEAEAHLQRCQIYGAEIGRDG